MTKSRHRILDQAGESEEDGEESAQEPSINTDDEDYYDNDDNDDDDDEHGSDDDNEREAAAADELEVPGAQRLLASGGKRKTHLRGTSSQVKSSMSR